MKMAALVVRHRSPAKSSIQRGRSCEKGPWEDEKEVVLVEVTQNDHSETDAVQSWWCWKLSG